MVLGFRENGMNKLRLRASDTGDLEIIAGAVQDSIFQIGQSRYDKAGLSFTLRLSRYMREMDTPHRVESGLRFDGVLSVKSQGVDLAKQDAYAVILGLIYEATDTPAGIVSVTLAGGGVIQIEVEAIDATLADIGDARKTKRIPKHDG